jgi:D-alanine-D-alanine ligase
MNVALTFNVKKNKPSSTISEQKDLEFDSPSVINGIKDTLKSLGHTVFLVEADDSAFLKLKELKSKIDIVFNIAEGLWGEARETQIPMICEILQIPYTHSGPTTHTICLDKSFTKLILHGADGIHVPDSHVVRDEKYVVPKRLKYPFIIKPNAEGSSKGVMDKNVVRNAKDLHERIKITSENFTKEVLIEEYIEGREFTVAVLGNDDPQVLPIIEQKFDFLPKGMNKIASFELKWIYEDALPDVREAYGCPAEISEKLKEEIENTSKEIYELLDVRDCARIDYRLDAAGTLYFIEINTLPGIIPPSDNVLSYFPLAAKTAGLSYKDLIDKILSLACERYGISG